MIQETRSSKRNPAITSDAWHVVHARWDGSGAKESIFVRDIVSEHRERAGAVAAARKLVSALSTEMYDRPHAQRDQIFVRRPKYKSLKKAARVDRRRR